MTFFSALAFVGGIAVMVLLAEPPGVVVPSSAWGRARWRGVKNRAIAHWPQGTTADPIAEQES